VSHPDGQLRLQQPLPRPLQPPQQRPQQQLQQPLPLRLVLASNNAKKLSELRSLLQGLRVQLVSQAELGITEADEPHCTFIENALAKARHAAAASGCAAIADDSGLCVDALDGAPGVISAHYAPLEILANPANPANPVSPVSPVSSVSSVSSVSPVNGAAPPAALPTDREALRRLQDEANNRLLLLRLGAAAAGRGSPAQAAQPGNGRDASFVCTLVAIRHAQDPQPLVAVGRWSGQILKQPRGELGFGYDPLMFIPGLLMTVAEMDAQTKNLHSHRARAMAQMQQWLGSVWGL